MRKTRVFIDAPLTLGSVIELNRRNHHHIANVLRHKIGTRLVFFNGGGGEFEGTLTHVSHTVSRATIDKFSDLRRESPLHTTLLQGISRSDRMDYALQKTVELGVSEIQPVIMTNSSLSKNRAHFHKKHGHWERVVTAACEQSGRTNVPEVFTPLPIEECLEKYRDRLGLVLLPEGKRSLAKLKPSGRHITVLVGPEGGLSEQEIELSDRYDFVPVGLGPRVLRTETAATAALTAIQILWGDMG